MPDSFVVFAFLLGALLGAFLMALLVSASVDREKSFESMEDDGLGVVLPCGDTSKLNQPDISPAGRVRRGRVAA